MLGVLNIFQSIHNADDGCLSLFLKGFKEHQSFQYENLKTVESIAGQLSAGLQKTEHRRNSLKVLEIFLEQCPLEIIEGKSALYTTLCTKICYQKELAPDVSEQCYRVLKVLVEKSRDSTELSKAFINGLLGKIIDTFSHVRSQTSISALKCLNKCLELYTSACGPFHSSILQFLLTFINSIDHEVVYWAAKCLLLLPPHRGDNPKNKWQTMEISVLQNLHKLLNIVYANCPEVYGFDDNSDVQYLPLDIDDLSKEPTQRATQLFNKFRNHIIFLNVFLREPCLTSKNIMPRKILNLIVRGLAVNCTLLGENPILDNFAIGALLPEFHMQLYELLESLLLTLKSHMALYVDTILNLILNTLKWTSTGRSDGQHKLYSNLRCSAYKTLSQWCKIMNYGSCLDSILDSTIQEIFYDITPFENEIQLQVLSGTKKHLSKKARKLLHKAGNDNSRLSKTYSKFVQNKNTFSDRGNSFVCIAALDCLKNIIYTQSCFLKTHIQKAIQDKIVTLVFGVEFGTGKENLYTNYFCRIELYNVLLALVEATHHLCPPPVEFAIQILSNAQLKDECALVRQSCSKHLKNIEKLLHPQKETLQFPLDLDKMRNIFAEYKQKAKIFETSVSNIDGASHLNDQDEGEHSDMNKECFSFEKETADMVIETQQESKCNQETSDVSSPRNDTVDNVNEITDEKNELQESHLETHTNLIEDDDNSSSVKIGDTTDPPPITENSQNNKRQHDNEINHSPSPKRINQNLDENMGIETTKTQKKDENEQQVTASIDKTAQDILNTFVDELID